MSALIAAQPGPLWNVLQALLLAMPQVETVHQAEDAASTLRAAEAHRPGLVLLDASLPDEGATTVVRTLKEGGHPIHSLVLADNVRQQQQILEAGADVVVLKGYPAARLYEVMEALVTAPQVQSKTDRPGGRRTSKEKKPC